jgi:hypothetical protein
MVAKKVKDRNFNTADKIGKTFRNLSAKAGRFPH